MITLQKLKWSNVFSYGPDNELDLSENGVTQIIGTNGMGKSSIPLIVEEALYNKNSKGIKKADIPNRYLKDGYAIQLEFTKDNKTYTVDIQRKSSIKVKLLENGEDISSHTATNTYKTLQEIIGIDFKTFSQLVYQNPNTSLQFLTATDTNRKKFLIDLLHLDNYVKLFDLFKEEAKRVSTNVTSIQSKINTIEKWLENNKLESTSVLELLEVEIDTEDDEQTLSSLRVELENISQKNKKILQNKKYKELLKSIDIDEINSIKATEEISYTHLTSEIGGLKQTVAGARQVLAKLEKLGDKCPTCEQSVDSDFKQAMIDEEKEKIQAAKNRNAEIQEQIAEIQKNNLAYETKINGQRDWEQLYGHIDNTLPDEILDREELEKEFKLVQGRIQDARGRLQEVISENEKRTKHNTRISIIQEQTEEFLEQLDEASELLKEEQKISSNLEVLKKAFSTNGLLAYKIENLVKELEELTNHYLAELSDGRFTLEFGITNDKLNVNVTDNGNTVDILALSSGELARVNTSTLLAIRKLMSSISKSRINVLFLDEVISVLDEVGKEKLVEILISEEDLNSYLVSHQWQHPLLSKIEVVKDDNISRLEI
jgi:DNA repair exonuclease SbcCD ATPase subunit